MRQRTRKIANATTLIVKVAYATNLFVSVRFVEILGNDVQIWWSINAEEEFNKFTSKAYTLTETWRMAGRQDAIYRWQWTTPIYLPRITITWQSSQRARTLFRVWLR